MTPATKMARKLSSGIHGRLDFDFACNRGHGFGEAYLHGLLIELLASNVDPQTDNILPSYAVPALQSEPRGAGRKREVDFVVATRSENPDLKLCVEAKWGGSSHATAERVLLDIARLCVVSRAHPNADCLFVLAGGKDAVTKLLGTGVLAPHGSSSRLQRLLKFPYDRKGGTYYLRPGPGHNSELGYALRSKLEEKLPEVPVRVKSFLYRNALDDPPDWRVYIWRVWS